MHSAVGHLLTKIAVTRRLYAIFTNPIVAVARVLILELRASSRKTETKRPIFLSFENLKGGFPFHAYLTSTGNCRAVGGAPFGRVVAGHRIARRDLHWLTFARKQEAAEGHASKKHRGERQNHLALFRGGLSPRICLSKSSQSRCSIS